MSDDRIQRLELIADRHERDLSTIARSIEELVEQNKITNNMIQDALLRDERFDAKLQKCELALKHQIDLVHATATRSHTRLDKMEGFFTKTLGTVLVFILLGILGATVKFGGAL